MDKGLAPDRGKNQRVFPKQNPRPLGRKNKGHTYIGYFSPASETFGIGIKFGPDLMLQSRDGGAVVCQDQDIYGVSSFSRNSVCNAVLLKKLL